MKKFKKIAAIGCAAMMVVSSMSMSVFAEDLSSSATISETLANTENEIYFVETDSDGNVIDITAPIYLEEVAKAYENSKMLRWVSTTYYNLANGPYTLSGGRGSTIQSGKHFNANSSGRLYYSGEVYGQNATLDIYDVTNGEYKGSFWLIDQGDGTYSKTGSIVGLSKASTQYYSFGLTSSGSNFTSYYAAISWNSL